MSLKAFDAETAKAQAEKALSLPVGMASPLWLAYGGVTAGALTWWWMNQWMKPMNLEAMSWPGMADFNKLMGGPSTIAAAMEEVVPAPVLAAVEPILEAVEIVAETAAQVVEKTPDDLTVLVGIGPTLAGKLADLGVTTYADIAAWNEADVESFDKQLKLLGRIGRDGWIEQARQLAEA